MSKSGKKAKPLTKKSTPTKSLDKKRDLHKSGLPVCLDPITGKETIYDPKYAKLLVEYAEKTKFGTINRFCLELGISRDTFYKWRRKYGEFRRAVDIAESLQEEKMMQIGHDGMQGKLKSFHNAAWIFWMKARFGKRWRDDGQSEDQEDTTLEFDYEGGDDEEND